MLATWTDLEVNSRGGIPLPGRSLRFSRCDLCERRRSPTSGNLAGPNHRVTGWQKDCTFYRTCPEPHSPKIHFRAPRWCYRLKAIVVLFLFVW